MSVLGQLLHDYARTRVFNVDALLLNEYAQPLGDESDGGAATTTGGVEHLMHACADLKQTGNNSKAQSNTVRNVQLATL
jgi:hypothetical protein